MFAVSENMITFVIAKDYERKFTIAYKKTANKAGLLLDDSILIGSWSLARLRGLRLFVLYMFNFFPTMPKIEEVSSTKVNNSNLSARPTHKFRVKISNYLSKNPKLCANVFGYSKNVCIFVMRTVQRIVSQSKDTHNIIAIKRGLFPAYLLEDNRYGLFAKHGGNLAYSFLLLTVNF